MSPKYLSIILLYLAFRVRLSCRLKSSSVCKHSTSQMTVLVNHNNRRTTNPPEWDVFDPSRSAGSTLRFTQSPMWCLIMMLFFDMIVIYYLWCDHCSNICMITMTVIQNPMIIKFLLMMMMVMAVMLPRVVPLVWHTYVEYDVVWYMLYDICRIWLYQEWFLWCDLWKAAEHSLYRTCVVHVLKKNC